MSELLDLKAFGAGMAILADRFNRPLLQATQLMYRQILSLELTPQEFAAAVKVAVRECTFWPSPKELIEFAKPPVDPGLEGARKFAQLLEMGEQNPGPAGGRFWRKEGVDRLGSAAAEAFAAIGGNARLRSIDAAELQWARREFVTHFKAAFELEKKTATATRALSAGAISPRLQAGNNHSDQNVQ